MLRTRASLRRAAGCFARFGGEYPWCAARGGVCSPARLFRSSGRGAARGIVLELRPRWCELRPDRWRWVHRGPWCLFRDRQVSVLDLISRRTIQHHRHRAGCAERTDERSSGTLRVLPSPESRRASPAFGYDATRIAGSSGRRDTLEARMSCPGTSVLYPRVVCVLYAHCAFPVESVNGTLTGWHRRTWSGTPFRGRGSRDK